jgi:uncharacterized membrane protein (DUF485 family)
MSKFFQNLKEKFFSMDSKQLTLFIMWIFTFILLILFVILAASLDQKMEVTYANTLASIGFIFVLALFSSLIITVIFANNKRNKEVNNE